MQKASPEMKGFPVRNLKYVRGFAEAYTDKKFVQGDAKNGEIIKYFLRFSVFLINNY